ncbi:MAG: hypothetical protein R6V12_19005, partial [Candidatus Hydrogenedentota bacterium]
KIHPQMVNHGMGYYERWFRKGYGHRWGHDTGSVEQVDKYRAQEIAYGHAGFIGNAQTNNVYWVAKEHHMMHPIQRLYGTSQPLEIAYAIGDDFVPASIALAMDQRERQRIRYDSGLTVWVNWAAEDWRVEGYTLPQWGFLALGPDTKVATYKINGHFADYAECPGFLFVDARTSFNIPYLANRRDIEPRLKSFEYLGNGKARIAYAWHVNEELDQDYRCFVHFTSDTSENHEAIVFQQDHALPTPTSQWRKDDVISDGPYEISIPEGPEERYNILIGLFDGGRVPLKGIEESRGRCLIGVLNLTRENGAITDVILGDLEKERIRYTTGKADFAAHMNPKDTWLDFGPVATDGSVKINLQPKRLAVFPYPREKEFRVEINLAAFAAKSGARNVRVEAIAAGSRENMGPVPHERDGDTLKFKVRIPDAGRYIVKWN